MPRDPEAIAAAVRQKTIAQLAKPEIARADRLQNLAAARKKRSADAKRLNERQRLMVQYFFAEADFVKTKAAKMVGIKDKSAALREFRKPQVVAEVKRRQALAEKRYEVTYDRLIEELSKLAFFNISDVMQFDRETGEFTGIDLNEATIDALAALGEIKIEPSLDGAKPRVTIKPYDKMKAITELLKHAGLSREVKQVHQVHEVTMADRLRKGREKMNKRLEQEIPIDAEFVEVVDAHDTGG